MNSSEKQVASSPLSVTAGFSEGHEPRYRRHQRGCAPLSGRPVYGWSVTCSCGWEKRTNEDKRYVERQFHAHHKTSSPNIKMTDADLPDVRTPDGRTPADSASLSE